MALNIGVFLTVVGWLHDRFKEKSTHQGLTLVGSVLGIWFSPEMSEQIIMVGTASLGLIQVVFKENEAPKIPDIEVTHERKQ